MRDHFRKHMALRPEVDLSLGYRLSDPTPQTEPPVFHDVAGRRIALRRRDGAGPGVVWLGGFKSDMLSTKASRLDAWAAAAGRARECEVSARRRRAPLRGRRGGP